MSKKPNKRVRTPVETEAYILRRSRRRCALCFGLHTDLGVKTVQIAHVNRDSSDSRAENLAALCLEHHNEYDSVFRQTKCYQPDELLMYRKQLYEVLDKRDTSVIGSFVQSPGTSRKEPTSARRLGEAAEALDEDLAREGQPNGIRLACLGQSFIEQAGDFVAGQEVVRALCELCEHMTPSEAERSSFFLNRSSALPHASPLTSLVKMVHSAARTDGSFALPLVLSLTHRGLYGERRAFSGFQVEDCPQPFYTAAASVLIGVAQEVVEKSADWLVQLTLSNAASLFLRSAIAFKLRGFDVPGSIETRFISGVQRVRPREGFVGHDGQPTPVPPGNWPPDCWFAVLDSLARLPEPRFRLLLTELPQDAPDWSPLLVHGSGADTVSADKAIELINAWTTFTGGISVMPIKLEQQGDVDRLRVHAARCREAAMTALTEVRGALVDEHRLVWHR